MNQIMLKNLLKYSELESTVSWVIEDVVIFGNKKEGGY